MIGDPYRLVKVWRSPSASRPDAWPGKMLTALYNERNTVTVYCVWNDDGTIAAAPRGMEDEIEDLQQRFGDDVRACSGSAPIA